MAKKTDRNTDTNSPVDAPVIPIEEGTVQEAKAVKAKPVQPETVPINPVPNPTDLEGAVVLAGDNLFKAVLALINDADFKAIMAIAAAHNFQYKGPEINNELQAMDQALKAYKGKA